MDDDQIIDLPGEVPIDWNRTPLRDLVEFVADGDWVETKDQGGSDYRLLQISNVGLGSFVETGKYRYISQETFDRLRCTAICEGDVLVARMPEPTGRAWFVDRLESAAITAVDVAIVRPSRLSIEGRYLAYFLNTPANLARVDGLATGTTRRRVRRADLARLTIPVPPVAEQRAIAGVLGALDDKIESNRRIQLVLLDLVETILDEAMSHGRRRRRLGEVAEFLNNRRRPLSAAERSLMKGLPRFPYYGATGAFDEVDDFLFDDITCLVGEDGSVVNEDGTPVTQLAWGRYWVNNHAHVLVGRSMSTELLFAVVRRADARPLVTGAVQAKISMSNLRGLELEMPTEISEVDATVRDLLTKWRSAQDQNKTLAALRDALLPELLSGRLRVREAEKVIEDVV